MENPIRFVCHVRASRKKAVEAAATETLSLLRGLDPSRCPGGPLSERGGVFWIEVPGACADRAVDRFARLGYTRAVDRLDAVDRVAAGGKGVVRWRKRYFRLARVYEEDASLMRERAPDRREFAVLGPGGTPRTVKGYRGDGTRAGCRALPVCDARLLVNMVRPAVTGRARFLDPFAGAGGVAIEALASGFGVCTLDVDPVVSPGLRRQGAWHGVADAGRLPFADSSFDAIATEPPYHRDLGPAFASALGDMDRVLAPGGKAAVLCADWHVEILTSRSVALGLPAVFEAPVDRKGTACRLFVWEKPGRSG